MSEPDGPRYRLYLDEAGDHAPCPSEGAPIGKRYLGLVGVILERGQGCSTVAASLEALKVRHFKNDPDDPVILHREDIKNRRGAFAVLQDQRRREAFDDDVIDLLDKSPLRVIAVVIDKLTHAAATHRRLKHPYHYCLLAMLQRYCGWFQMKGSTGDVMVEARGKVEDQLFKKAYEAMWAEGGPYLPRSTTRQTLSSKHVKMKTKAHNIPGLQFADILAHPLTRDVLVAYSRVPDRGGAFADRVCVAVEPKYNRHLYQNRINGYGRVILS